MVWLRSHLYALLAIILATSAVQAQLVPDATLGDEASTLLNDRLIQGDTADLIEGGAARGSNLFHSFSEFNVNDGQRVYFANPAEIESILSRVTGNSPSEIFGTLGVNGPADLFLINPYGLVFGENAQLDIPGSFYGTTAEAVEIGDGVFSATAPEQSQLLTVSPSVSFWNYLTENSGNITNRGALAVEGDLVLAGNQLDLESQVAAVGDVSLSATDAIKIRDTAATPFIAFAGEDLLVQGNQQIDIIALNHPDSGLFSYGDMILRSAERIGGDSYYWSGSDFRVETLTEDAGNLYSPIDPIIRALSDVVIDRYEGTSLHVLAGGSVTIDTAVIIEPEIGTSSIDFLQETLTLTDGTVVEIDGQLQPTLDIRAGINPEIIGTPPVPILTGFDFPQDRFIGNAFITNVSTNANITVGNILIPIPNGLVLLTNQYESNSSLFGDIFVEGRGFLIDGIDVSSFDDQGGKVFLDSRNNIVVNSLINTSSLNNAGDIVLAAEDSITFSSASENQFVGAFSDVLLGGQGNGGDIQITARNLEVLDGSRLESSVSSDGRSGDVIIQVEETAIFEGGNLIGGLAGGAFSNIRGPDGGQGGKVKITARNLDVLNGAQLGTGTFGTGNAGSVILNISETARFEGSDPIDGRSGGVFSNIESGATGQSGTVQITAGNLEVLNGARLTTASFGIGDAGSVVLNISETARFEGVDPFDGSSSSVSSSIEVDAEGEGGDIRITADDLEILNGAQIGSGVSGIGNAGSIVLNIGKTARLEGNSPVDSTSSGAFTSVTSTGQGRGGDIRVSANNLELLNGGRLDTTTFGIGDAGDIAVNVTQVVRIAGSNTVSASASRIASGIEPNSIGRGGDIRVSANALEVFEGGQIGSAIFGIGIAGDVVLDINETARFEGVGPIGKNPSGVFSIIEPTGLGQGNDILISANNLEILDGAFISARSVGRGDAGNLILDVRDRIQVRDGTITTNADFDAGGQIQIDAGIISLFGDSDIQTFVNSGADNGGDITITADAVVALDDSDILAFAADGRGGNVDLSRTAFFGQDFSLAPFGTDPRTLDGNNRVDINATGRLASGNILLPDVSFIQDTLTELPDNLVNPETLVSDSCIARSNDTASSFTLTGSDGLPSDSPQPSYSLSTVQPTTETTNLGQDTSVIEPHQVYQLSDGRLVMSRECNEMN